MAPRRQITPIESQPVGMKPGNLFQVFQANSPHLLTETQALRNCTVCIQCPRVLCVLQSGLCEDSSYSVQLLQSTTSSALGCFFVLTLWCIYIGRLHLRLPRVLGKTQSQANHGKYTHTHTHIHKSISAGRVRWRKAMEAQGEGTGRTFRHLYTRRGDGM